MLKRAKLETYMREMAHTLSVYVYPRWDADVKLQSRINCSERFAINFKTCDMDDAKKIVMVGSIFLFGEEVVS